MNLKECYEIIGDYNDVMARIPMEKLIMRCVCKFPNDTSYKELKEATESKNSEEIFKASHKLKGVTRNLGLMKLFDISDHITELYRDQKEHDIDALMEALDEEYDKVIAAIQQLAEENA